MRFNVVGEVAEEVESSELLNLIDAFGVVAVCDGAQLLVGGVFGPEANGFVLVVLHDKNTHIEVLRNEDMTGATAVVVEWVLIGVAENLILLVDCSSLDDIEGVAEFTVIAARVDPLFKS